MGRFHDVTVLTRENNKEVIECYLASNPDFKNRVRFVYFDLPQLYMRLKKRLKAHELYYVLWQRRARKVIECLIEDESIDLVHLVTFASFRYPVFLSNLSVPVVWGPVGGAEMAPWKLLWYRMRFPACLKEVLRNVATKFSEIAVRWIDPTRTSGGVVIASTPRTQEVLRRKGIEARLMPTIGVDAVRQSPMVRRSSDQHPLRFLFVGRLVLLKGGHLLLDAFAEADIDGATLTIVGDGGERGYLEALSRKLGLEEKVRFVGQVPKQDLVKIYFEHDVVVGPSLYESGGYMVLEGFQQCRPAIVLDVGGPALSVDESCGIKVEIGCGKDVVSGLASAMRYYSRHSDDIISHGRAGYRKLQNSYVWEKKAQVMRNIYAFLAQGDTQQ